VGAADGRNISLLPVLPGPIRGGRAAQLEISGTYVYIDNVGGLWSGFDDGGLLEEEQNVAVYCAGIVRIAVGESIYLGYEDSEKCVSDCGVSGDGSYAGGSVLSLSIFEEERFFRSNVGGEECE